LTAAECGNEPNAWLGNGFRTAPYGYPQYRPEWEACADAVANNAAVLLKLRFTFTTHRAFAALPRKVGPRARQTRQRNCGD